MGNITRRADQTNKPLIWESVDIQGNNLRWEIGVTLSECIQRTLDMYIDYLLEDTENVPGFDAEVVEKLGDMTIDKKKEYLENEGFTFSRASPWPRASL